MTHLLDEWDNDAEKSQKDFAEKALRQSSLVFQVFSTAAGQELLGEWIEILINSPSAYSGADMITIGMNEGSKAFMRSIIQAVRTHEEAQ